MPDWATCHGSGNGPVRHRWSVGRVTNRTADAYRKNYQRLQRVKAEYDPDNFFRMNRNISPTA